VKLIEKIRETLFKARLVDLMITLDTFDEVVEYTINAIDDIDDDVVMAEAEKIVDKMG